MFFLCKAVKQEDLFVIKNQSLDADEQKKNDILSIIKSCNNLKDTIRVLEKEKLVWYFIGPLLQDKDIREQVILKWETDFQEFEQSIIKTQNGIRNKFEKILSGQSFSAYSTKDNNFNIRFEDEEKPIKISDILRVSNEDEVYNLFLGGDSQIIACKKNSNERYYNFTGASSCEMAIYWQAKDSRGNDISCSIAVVVGSGGIQRIIGEPRFGDLKFTDPLPEETKNEILKLVEQNKEVFINEKTLYQVFADIYKNVNSQQKTEERITQDPYISPQSPTQDSSGYSSLGTPPSRRSSISTSSKFGDEEFETTDEYIDDDYDKQTIHKNDKRKYEQDALEDDRSISSIANKAINEIEELDKTFAQRLAQQEKQLADLQRAISEKDQRIKVQDALIKSLTDQNKDANEVLKENTYLKQQNTELKDRNTKITEESDVQISKLIQEEQTLKQEVERLKEEVKRLKAELEGKVKELVGKDRNIERLKQQVNALEQSQKNKDIEIADLKSELLGLKSQLRDEKNKSQSTDKINEELRKKLEISETELNKSKAGNTKLRDDMKKISESSEDDHNKQLAEFLLEKDQELIDVTDQLNKEQLKNQELSKELSQLQKEKEALEREIQQSNVSGKSLADEMKEVDENKDKKIGSLREEVKQKDEKIQQIVKENEKLEGKLQGLDKKYSEVKNKDEEYIKSLTYKLNQAESELINNQGELTDQIEKLKEEKENLLEQLRTKSTDSASFRKKQSEIDKLTQQLKEKEEMLINTQKELESVKWRLDEELQNVSKQGESQTVAVSTQTEVGYESRGIQASIQQHHIETETTMPETRNQDTQAVDKSSNKIVSGLRQENKDLTRDKQTISEQLKQKVREIEELKERLKKSQEENKQLKQKVTKGTGVDASSSTDQEETKGMEVQTDVQVSNFHDLYDKEGRYVRTELSDPNLTPNDPEKSR